VPVQSTDLNVIPGNPAISQSVSSASDPAAMAVLQDSTANLQPVQAVDPLAKTDSSTATSTGVAAGTAQFPKRLHVSNIPFRFRDPDLRALFGVSYRLRLLQNLTSVLVLSLFAYSFTTKKINWNSLLKSQAKST
jgi:hypothetical protein